MCIGCGACSVRTKGAVPVTIGRYGVYQASLDGLSRAQISAASEVCPFSDHAKNEDQLSAQLFPALDPDPYVGRTLSVFAGRLLDESFLLDSSSGGITSFVLEQLLVRGEVDSIIHVGRGVPDELFGYRISNSVEEMRASRKSVYYSTTLVDVLETAIASDRRFAVVGVPCFITAVRLLAEKMPSVAQSLKFCVGIVCGHMKSQFFSESLAWQAGISPAKLSSIDFRVKHPGLSANQYDYEATSTDGQSRVKSVRSTVDGNWGYGAFQPEACNFCDDIFAETADIVLGDAWLPQYESDWRGTNVIITRKPIFDVILREGAAAGRLVFDELSPTDAQNSQAGNYRHRRDGLAVRLADDKAQGLSVPEKRVSAGYPVGRRRIALIRKRRALSRLSLTAFARAREAEQLEVYLTPMRLAIAKYKWVEASGRGFMGLIRHAAKILLRRA